MILLHQIPSKQTRKRIFHPHAVVRLRSLGEIFSLVGLLTWSHSYGFRASVSRESQTQISLICPCCSSNHNHSLTLLDCWLWATPEPTTPSSNLAVSSDSGSLLRASYHIWYTQYYNWCVCVGGHQAVYWSNVCLNIVLKLRTEGMACFNLRFVFGFRAYITTYDFLTRCTIVLGLSSNVCSESLATTYKTTRNYAAKLNSPPCVFVNRLVAMCHIPVLC